MNYFDERDSIEAEMLRLCESRVFRFDRFEEVLDHAKKFEGLIERFKATHPLVSKECLLYRGQSNSEDKLESTLFRRYGEYPVDKYYRNLIRTVPFVETAFELNLKLPEEFRSFGDRDKILEVLSSHTQFSCNLPMLGYMVYARHFGYPSPLLDWTKSIFVAAYFAYKGAFRNRNTAKNGEFVAIFMHLDSISSSKFINKEFGDIIRVNPFEKTSPRHYAQKAVYTVCANPNPYPQKMPEGRELKFMSHNDAIHNHPAASHEDVVIKYELPAFDRNRVLKMLDKMNINDYTLFNSMESLMNWLAESEFEE